MHTSLSDIRQLTDEIDSTLDSDILLPVVALLMLLQTRLFTLL